MQTFDTRPPPTHQPVPPRRPSSTGRTAATALGAVMLVGATGLLAGAGLVHAADSHWREGGYLTTETMTLSTGGYAIAAADIDLEGLSGSWALGDTQLRVTGTDGTSHFVGIARADDAADFLSDIQHVTLDELDEPANRYDEHAGDAPAARPTDSDIWVDQALGTGTQHVSWPTDEGSWTLVVMNADATNGVHVDADVGSEAPIIHRIVVGLVIGGALSAAMGVFLILLAQRRRPEQR